LIKKIRLTSLADFDIIYTEIWRKIMYEIYDEYGHRFDFATESYRLACHVAHWVRSLLACEGGVVDGGRFVSEVYDVDRGMDIWAKAIAERMVE
jgi:hypothetical protein